MPQITHPIANALSAALVSLMLTLPAAAERSDTAIAFDIMVSGKTFDFYIADGGTLRLFGHERYFADQSVVWVLTDGQCLEGVWFERDGEICFNYGGRNDTCWRLDDSTPEDGATFSYSIGAHRQVAFPSDQALPASCDPLLS